MRLRSSSATASATVLRSSAVLPAKAISPDTFRLVGRGRSAPQPPIYIDDINIQYTLPGGPAEAGTSAFIPQGGRDVDAPHPSLFPDHGRGLRHGDYVRLPAPRARRERRDR